MNVKTKRSAWVLIAAVSFGLGIPLACDTPGRSVSAAKPAGEAQPLFTPVAASLEQQKMCAEQGAKRSSEYRGGSITPQGSITFSNYTSHYDPSVNVCYFHVHYASGDPTTVVDRVFDAFGGRAYATYIWDGSNGDVPTTCKILIPDKPVQLCKSTTEFNELVERYFGAAQ